MGAIRVGVVGPGTIGHKVVWALERQKDMTVSGVAKTSPDWVAKWVASKGIRLYPSSKEGKKGVPAAIKAFKDSIGEEHVGGTIEDLLEASDVIVDCTGSRFGAKNKEELYEPYNKEHDGRLKVLFQGGEDAGIGCSFNTRTSYDKCVKSGTPYFRVVSCNTTGLARIVGGLLENGYEIDYLTAALLRRSTDPGMPRKMRLDDFEVSLKIPSHHAPDLKEVVDVEAYSRAYKAPVSAMHMHDIHITFKDKVPSKDDFMEVFRTDGRVALLERFSSTIELRERVRRLNKIEEGMFPGGDVFLTTVSTGSYQIYRKKKLWLTQGIPQDSIVVPETIDAVRAATYGVNKVGRDASMKMTDDSLSLPGMKRILEDSYSS